MRIQVSLLVGLAMLVSGNAKVIRGQQGVRNREGRKLQFLDPIDEAVLYGIEVETPEGGSKGKGTGGSKSTGGSSKSKSETGKSSGDDDDDDDDGHSGPCSSIKTIPKSISDSNTKDRSRSEHWQFYCHVFEHYYATSHCVNDRCGDVPRPPQAIPQGPSDEPFPETLISKPEVPIDLQFGNPIFSEMEKGICLLLQFHNDICPADPLTSCQCDSAYEWNPITDTCDRYQGESASTDLDLIGYCENLIGGSWDDSLSGTSDVSNECLRGCTRYIAAEGHACCPHTCDCTAQYRKCPEESCAYCRSCCDSCDGCDAQGDYPNVCREEKPCEPQRIRCNCIGETDCPCDLGEPSDLPIICPCVGEAECLCDPCGVVIIRDEDESPDDGVIERPVIERPTGGSQDGGSPDNGSDNTENTGTGTEPTTPLVDNIAAFPPVEPTNPPIEATSPPIAPTNPPIEATSPPVEPTSPPVEATNPPIEATNPPIEATSPPVEPTSPAVEPTSPPVEPTNPSMPDSTVATITHDQQNISNDEGQEDLDTTGGSV